MVAFLSPGSLRAYPSLGWAFGFGTLSGPEEKKLYDLCPLDGERVLVRLGKANHLA